MVLLEAKSVGLDVLIPKHLEKYCPDVKGTIDTIEYLKKYKKSNKKKEFNSLSKYNNDIKNKIDKLFSK